jgi:hypothetical protein
MVTVDDFAKGRVLLLNITGTLPHMQHCKSLNLFKEDISFLKGVSNALHISAYMAITRC